MYECPFPDFFVCIVILKEIVLVYRKHSLKYPGMMGHWTGNLLSNNPGKKNLSLCTCTFLVLVIASK